MNLFKILEALLEDGSKSNTKHLLIKMYIPRIRKACLKDYLDKLEKE